MVGMVASPVLLFGVVTGASFLSDNVNSTRSGSRKKPHDTVAHSWSDGIDADGSVTIKQFYGAHIYTVKRSNGFDVYCRVHIGQADYFHDCGHLGTVSNPREARELWGEIEWTNTQLIVGDPEKGGIVVPRSEIQNHR